MIKKSSFTVADILFIACIILFCICKFPALHLPYFWDELGVYARASLYLSDHHLSILPAALPPELSRGHPLLFYFFHALSMRLFNDSVLTAHLTALFISCLFLISLYLLLKKETGAWSALAIVLLLMLQPLFYTQSVFVLPEVSLALFIWLSIYAFKKERYISYTIFSSLAILIKETAVIIPVVCFAYLLLNLKRNTQPVSSLFKKQYLSLLISPAIFLIFICIQKLQNGWYFFPYHTGAIQTNVSIITTQFSSYSHFLFLEQGRIYLTFGALFIFLLANIVNSINPLFSFFNRLIFSCIILTLLFLFYEKAELFLLFFIISLLLLFNKFIKNDLSSISVFCLLLLTIGLAFSSLNFYMNRYVLFLLPAFCMLFFNLLSSVLLRKNSWLILLFVLAAFIPAYLAMQDKEFSYDTNMSYTNYLELQQKTSDFIEHDLKKEKNIYYTNFPMYFALSDIRFGFVKSALDSTQLIKGHELPEQFTHIIHADPGSFDEIIPLDGSLTIDTIFTNQSGSISIYQKK